MKVLSILALLASLGGCHYYQDYRLKKTQADVQEQRAANMRAHRDCMARYEGHPNASQICGQYLQ